MPTEMESPWLRLDVDLPFIRASFGFGKEIIGEATKPRESDQFVRVWVGVGGKDADARPAVHHDQRLHYPPELSDLFRLAHDKAPGLPVAVFLDAGQVGHPSLLDSLMEQFFNERLLIGQRLPSEIVLLPERDWQARRTLELPLQAVAAGEESSQLFRTMRQQKWYAGDPGVAEHGLLMFELPRYEPLAALYENRVDIIFCDRQESSSIASAINEIPFERRPRLLVIIDKSVEYGLADVGRIEEPPAGVSLIWLPVMSDQDSALLVEDVLLGVIHDQPLHLIMNGLRTSRRYRWRRRPTLVADPLSLHDLRVNPLVAGLAIELDQFNQTDFLGDVGQFLNRVKNVAPLDVMKQLQRLAFNAEPMRTMLYTVGLVNLHRPDFTHESSGLLSLAGLLASKATAERMRGNVHESLQLLAKNPAARELFAREQNRQVDISLRRLDAGAAGSPFVHPEQSLRRNTGYQLRVQIGRHTLASLMQGDVPPLDPLLPESGDEGHLLHVVVHGLDFQVEKPAMQRLILPPLGPSRAITFEVRTPRTRGPARLRVAVYYDLPPGENSEQQAKYCNYLLQSFLLETEIAEEEAPGFRTTGEGITRVRLEFSRSRRLTDLERMPRRALSLSVNSMPGEATHTLTFKSGGEAGEFHITEHAMEDRLKQARDLLRNATRSDAGGPRFTAAPAIAADAPARREMFDGFLRSFAWRGEELYNKIWGDARADFQQGLHRVRGASDEIIQIVRHDQNYLFPWALLYDFPLPKEVAGTTPPAVCDGYLRKDEHAQAYSCQRCLKECLFPDDKSKTFCVYGFWGMRHQIEQSLHTPFKNQDRIDRVKPCRPEGLLVALGLQGGHAGALIADMSQGAASQFLRRLKPNEDLLDVLWQPANRPWLVLLLSHYTHDLKSGEPLGPRLGMPGGRWFQGNDLFNRRRNGAAAWDDPHPIVLLAACGAVAEDLKTLTGFLTAFADAGAAAVVGTETIIYESLAARFGKEISLAIVENRTLGQALVDFRRGLLLENNPLGFVFTPYGEADLTLEFATAAGEAPVAVTAGS